MLVQVAVQVALILALYELQAELRRLERSIGSYCSSGPHFTGFADLHY